MKWIKRLFIGVAVVLLLFVIAAAVFVATFDPNDYKQRIEVAVEQATGRELALQGDIELSLFPWLGMTLGPARLGNAPGFGDEPFARVENVQVRVAVLPLFGGEVRADTVTLEGLEANPRINEQGISNWEDLLKEEKPAPADEPQQPGRGLALAIGGIEIEDAAVHWVDAQAGTDVRIAPINLSTGELAFGEPFDIELDMRMINAQPAVEVDLDVSAEATIAPQAQRYRLADLELTANAQGEGLPKDGVAATLETGVDVDLVAGSAQLRPLTLQAANVRLMGQISASGLNAEPQVQGELSSDAFSPRKLLTALGQELPPTRDPDVLENAVVKLAFNATTDSARLSQLAMQLDDTHLTGQASVQSFDDPKIDFNMALDAIDLDRYQPPEAEPEAEPEAKPPPPADDDLGLPIEMLRELHLDGRLTAGTLKASDLTFADLQATISARDGLIKVTPVGMNLYQGSLKGNATVDVRGDTPTFAVDSVLDGVQAGGVVAQLFGDDYLTGSTGLTLNLKTQGQRLSALQQALNGNLAVRFKEGSIWNSELAGRISRVVAFFKGGGEQVGDPAETRFTSLTGSAKVANGVLASNDLTLTSPQILAKGEGRVNIPQSRLDYTLSVALNDAGKPRGNRYVPIGISGAFSDLDYTLALTDAVKEQAGQAIRQELQEKEQELQEDIQEKQQELQESLQEKLQQELKDRFNF